MGKKNPKKAVEYVPFGDLSLEDVVSCPVCGGIFNQEVAEDCPRCKSNPGPDAERDADGFDKDGFDKDGTDKNGFGRWE